MVLGSIVLVPLLARSEMAPRELVFVARDMAFHVPGQTPENPVVRVFEGEALRVVLQNDDEGIKHDLAVPEWGLTVDALRSGSAGAATVRVPDEPGRVEYICKRHGALMKGTIEVVSR
jgi:hypothetical protein